MEPLVAIDGRPLGKRAAHTRARLLDATVTLLETHGVRDLRVAEIARAVGTSPATFYQYFRDVEDAVLAMAAAVGDEIAPLAELLDDTWDESSIENARALVDGFVTHWDRHRAVLRTCNLAAQEGDIRFRDVCNRANAPFLDALTRQISDPALTPRAAAAAIVALLERMAAFHAEFEPMGIARADLVETTARIVHRTVVSSTS